MEVIVVAPSKASKYCFKAFVHHISILLVGPVLSELIGYFNSSDTIKFA